MPGHVPWDIVYGFVHIGFSKSVGASSEPAFYKSATLLTVLTFINSTPTTKHHDGGNRAFSQAQRSRNFQSNRGRLATLESRNTSHDAGTCDRLSKRDVKKKQTGYSNLIEYDIPSSSDRGFSQLQAQPQPQHQPQHRPQRSSPCSARAYWGQFWPLWNSRSWSPRLHIIRGSVRYHTAWTPEL